MLSLRLYFKRPGADARGVVKVCARGPLTLALSQRERGICMFFRIIAASLGSVRLWVNGR